MALDLTLSASDSLKVHLTSPKSRSADPAVRVHFSGLINEDTNFGIILQALGTLDERKVAFDVSGVTRMNSCGVREWILFIEKLQAMKNLAYSRLNEVFIEQINMVPDLLGTRETIVHAVDVPYYCSSCDSTTVQVIRLEEIYSTDGGLVLKEFDCKQCQSPTEIDAIPSEYFNFLRFTKVGTESGESAK